MTSTPADPASDAATDADATDEAVLAAMYQAPFGPLTLVANRRGLEAILWRDQSNDHLDIIDLEAGISAGQGTALAPVVEVLALASTQLDEYFAGERQDFDIPLDARGTEFQREAWQALCDIPYGETTSYGKQAAALGRPKASRAVGAANGQNPIPIVVPCHRVVGANGKLTGFAGGLDLKTWLLDHERQNSGASLPFG